MKLRNVKSVGSFTYKTDEFCIDFYANGEGLLRMMCANDPKKMCGIKINRGEPNQAKAMHGWDGDFDNPTITPSIGCGNAPRCGWHGHITKGERTP